jgi:hypothetical protein
MGIRTCVLNVYADALNRWLIAQEEQSDEEVPLHNLIEVLEEVWPEETASYKRAAGEAAMGSLDVDLDPICEHLVDDDDENETAGEGDPAGR